MLTSERIIVTRNRREVSDESLNNYSFSSNDSFYENLELETKKDIIFLIKSGYNKKLVIKLYIFAKPSNLNEAVNYLTKENGIYQHIFVNSSNDEDSCEICGDKKINHINEINKSSNISFNSSIYMDCKQKKSYNRNILTIRTKEEIKNKCKICEEDISKEEEIKNKCEQCNNYFCSECLYLHIKELIKNGKYALFCPECKFIYTKNKIEQFLLFNIKNKDEINNLKQLLQKNNTKEMILSNPELMFCPIPNCDGFARKNNNKEYNICTLGHKFCIKCGELWHENGKCKEEENVDKLFKQFYKQYNIKNCPYCHIATKKNGGCNHMKCNYCGKHWCWLCQKIFTSTEEHYGNINSTCYNRMNVVNEGLICSKCNNEINDNDIRLFRIFRCDHIICNKCYEEYLLQNKTMIFFPEKIINCAMPECHGIIRTSGDNIIQFINKTKNVKLIKKYHSSILFYDYFLHPLFPRDYCQYIEVLGSLFESFSKLFDGCKKYEIFYDFLIIIGIIFALIFFLVYIMILPITSHIKVRKLYFVVFLPEIRKQYNNKILNLLIILGEELLSLALLFTLLAFHYIYTFLFFPILGLVLLIRKFIYKLEF